MRRWCARAAVTAVVLALPPGAAAWDEVAVSESSGDAIATCLRDGGPGVLGLVGPVRGSTTSYDLMRHSDAGLRREARIRLPVIYECPELASNGTRTVVGVVTGAGRLAAWVVEGGAARRLALGARERPDGPPAVAVAPDGSAVVAWVDARLGSEGGIRRTRIRVRRLAQTGQLGPARTASGWRRAGGFAPHGHVAVAMDATGSATIAWSQPVPDRGRRVPGGSGIRAITDMATVGAGTLSPDGRWDSARLSKDVQGIARLALAVAPDGHAVLAHDGNAIVRVFDRAASTDRFVPRGKIADRERGASDPAVAVGPGGGAVVAWLTGADFEGTPAVRAASRPGPGAFAQRHLIRPRRSGRGSDGGSFFFAGAVGHAIAPLDEGNSRLRSALAADGRWLVSWGEAARSRFADAPVAPFAATGRLGERLTGRRRLGCRCRAVNGVVPTLLEGGGPGVAFTDNATVPLAIGVRDVGVEELPSGDGRLHIADPAVPAPRGSAPRLTVSARLQLLRYGDPVRVRARCDRPCDLRAVVPGTSRPWGREFPPERGVRAIGTATLPHGGAATLAAEPAWAGRLAPLRPGPVRIVVRAWPHGGDGPASVRTVAPRLTLIRPRPLPRPLGVRAVRRGRRVAVSWRMPRPARRVSFNVILRPLFTRGERPEIHERFLRSVGGRGRRRFRVTLRLRPGDTPSRAELVVTAHWPPYRSRVVRVPIERRG